MECRKSKTQYAGKCKTAFNIRLNNHRTNAYRPTNYSIPACKHFHRNGHVFNRDAKLLNKSGTQMEKHKRKSTRSSLNSLKTFGSSDWRHSPWLQPGTELKAPFLFIFHPIFSHHSQKAYHLYVEELRYWRHSNLFVSKVTYFCIL